MAETDIYYLHTMIASTRSYIKDNRDKVSKISEGFLGGHRLSSSMHKKESIEIVKKEASCRRRARAESRTFLSICLSYEILRERRLIHRCAASRRCSDYVEKDNPKAKSADPKSFVDDSLLREIDQSGFIKKLYER